MTDALSYYATPGPMTDLSACPQRVLDDLPDDPASLMKIVRGCIVAGVPVPEGRDDMQVRHADVMVERILALHPEPLTERREPEKRFIGCCRHFATLTCALLRHRGVPARVRAGFAAYFGPSMWADHWVIEHWRGGGWVRVDAQYSDRWFQQFDPAATSESVVAARYLSGGQSWLRCRSGDLDPGLFNMGGGDNWGIGEVRGSVLYDLAALNKDEMLPWDVWGRMKAAYDSETDAAYDELLDTVSAVTIDGDLDAIRKVYEDNADLCVPAALR